MPLAGPVPAAEPETLHVLVDGSTDMPQAQIRGEQVVDGLQHDVALEIGRRVGRRVAFRLVPRRRVAQLLVAGERADMICHYRPAWLPGPLQWSQPYLDDGEVLITARRHPAPTRLADVAGQPLGTIAGFLYPDVEAVLGRGFVRDDAPHVASSLRKLASGRMDHALLGRNTFEYLLRRGEVPVELHPPLLLTRWRTGCALSPRSSLRLADLDAAIRVLQTDGSLTRILDRYR